MTKVLDVKNLRVYFHTPLGPVKAVDGISFDLNPKERLGIVGESGSGKSTMALSLMRLIKKPGKIESGEIIVGDENILNLDEGQMRDRRFSKISLIPQGSMNSLNPVMRIEEQLIDTIKAHDESKSSVSKIEKK
jgi:peptide/nickel transport system ATP-binding protein